MNSEKMFELADQLRNLREQKQEMEKHLKDINAKIDETDYQLSEIMAETETQNFTRSGIMFYLTSTTRASAVAGCKDELFAALKDAGFGELVTETVNANSLSSFVREQMGENEDILPDWLNGLVNIFEKTSVGVRKSGK